MTKIQAFEDDGVTVGYMFECRGCKLGHAVHIKPHKNDLGASWTFDGNLDAPTFSPSILSKVEAPHKMMICHLFVRGGRIEYLGDCTHELAGQTVEMEDID